VSVRFWEPGKEFHRIETEVMDTMREVLSKGDLIMRQQMLDFEHNLAAFVGTADAIGVSNCTDGLRLLLEAVGIGPGDEVITVSHTFMATMAVIHQVGATPILVDVGADHNMNVDLVEGAITPRTKAIMPVYLNGRLVQMDRLMEIARAHKLLVIEDTAQALGGAYLGVRGGAGFCLARVSRRCSSFRREERRDSRSRGEVRTRTSEASPDTWGDLPSTRASRRQGSRSPSFRRGRAWSSTCP